jgi:hypothetical protein
LHHGKTPVNTPCAAAITLTLTGCVPTFGIDAQATRHFDCVDVGWTVRQDDRVPGTSLVLDLGLRNRCVRPVPIDVSAMRITAQGAPGANGMATLYDPRHEMGKTRIDVKAEATERIRLDLPLIEGLSRLCFDVSDVLGGAPPSAAPPACVPIPVAPKAPEHVRRPMWWEPL